MATSTKYRVLIVDDEPSVRESLTRLLDEAGYDVNTAEHGLDALLQLRRMVPDVIISDLNMPQMSGSSSSRSCAGAFLGSRWLRSAALTNPALTSLAESSPMRSTPKGGIIPQNS